MSMLSASATGVRFSLAAETRSRIEPGEPLAAAAGRHPRSPDIALRPNLLRLGWIAVAAWPTAVLAGLSLDEAIARHRSLGAPSGGVATVAPTPIAIEDEDRDDVTVALGGPRRRHPAAASPRAAR
jgi:hypothetical protein